MSGRTAEQYRQLLDSLLPKGKIWNREKTSVLQRLLYGLADELSRIEGRTFDLITEKDVRTTEELITEHEEDYGLPKSGEELANTLADRRNDLHAALLTVGQQYKEYFIDIAAAAGYTITIEEFTPAWSGVAMAGDACGDQVNIFYWKVWIDLDSVTYSYEVNISKLITKISSIKPGHSHLLFEFYGAEFSRAFSRAFDSIPHYDNSWPDGEFNRDFSNAFANAFDYDGKNYIGAFNQAFSIATDRYSGGSFSDSFGIAFLRPR